MHFPIFNTFSHSSPPVYWTTLFSSCRLLRQYISHSICSIHLFQYTFGFAFHQNLYRSRCSDQCSPEYKAVLHFFLPFCAEYHLFPCYSTLPATTTKMKRIVIPFLFYGRMQLSSYFLQCIPLSL